MLGRDQRRAPGQIRGVDQGAQRPTGRWDEIRVGHVFIAVGVRQPLGLGDQVHAHHTRATTVGVEIVGPVLIHGEVLEDSQSGGHRDATR